MTQVPGPSQRPVDTPVVPGDASTLDSPAEASTTVATARQDVDPYELLTRALKLAGDAASLTQHGPRYWTRITGQLLADTNLLDALVAYRQQRRVITDHAALDALPVGSVVMDSPYPEGDVHQRTSDGFWAEPGFDGMFTTQVLSLPAVLLWTPPDTIERPTE